VTRIVLVGAGSVEFTRNLLGDILTYPELADATIVLHDIDADRLATAERMTHWTAGVLGAGPRVEAHLDRRAALTGADFVIDTIQVGGARARRSSTSRSRAATAWDTRSTTRSTSAA
jgi:alpha-galactosidase